MLRTSQKPLYEAVAAYAYTAKSDRELTIAKGDSLLVLKECSQWLYVQNTEGKRGSVPANYTRRVSKQEEPAAPAAATAAAATATAPKADNPPSASGAASPLRASSPQSAAADPTAPSPAASAAKKSLKRVVAIKDVKSAASGNLSVREGDVIIVLEEYATGWIRGDFDGKEGLVPADAVKPYQQEAVLIETASLYRAKAIYDYTAAGDGQLSFKKGDVLPIVKDDIPGGWLLANQEGKLGHVPKAYFKKIHERAEHKKKPSDAKVNGDVKDPDGVMPDCPFKAVVLYNYSGDSASILTIAKEEVLTIEAYKHGGWLVARNEQNKMGHVSRKYVKPYEEKKAEEKEKKEKKPEADVKVDVVVKTEEKVPEEVQKKAETPEEEEKKDDIAPPPVTEEKKDDIPPPSVEEKQPEQAPPSESPAVDEKKDEPKKPEADIPPPSVQVSATVDTAAVDALKEEMEKQAAERKKEMEEMKQQHEKEMSELKEEMKQMQEAFKKEFEEMKELLNSMKDKQDQRIADLSDEVKEQKKRQDDLAARPSVDVNEFQEEQKKMKELDKSMREQMQLQRSLETQFVKVKAQFECLKGSNNPPEPEAPSDAAPEVSSDPAPSGSAPEVPSSSAPEVPSDPVPSSSAPEVPAPEVPSDPVPSSSAPEAPSDTSPEAPAPEGEVPPPADPSN